MLLINLSLHIKARASAPAYISRFSSPTRDQRPFAVLIFSQKMSIKCLFLLTASSVLLLIALDPVSGHGMVMSPVARGSRWRFDSRAPINYNDNGNFCGGFYVGFLGILVPFHHNHHPPYRQVRSPRHGDRKQ